MARRGGRAGGSGRTRGRARRPARTRRRRPRSRRRAAPPRTCAAPPACRRRRRRGAPACPPPGAAVEVRVGEAAAARLDALGPLWMPAAGVVLPEDRVVVHREPHVLHSPTSVAQNKGEAQSLPGPFVPAIG